MGRKIQISKDVILKTALAMLLRDGYGAINIKTLAAEIGCSTQPIVWHFENMAGFRREFFAYCLDYAMAQFAPWNGQLDDLLTETARGYLTIACNMPHLFRFVFVDNQEESQNSEAVQALQMHRTKKLIHLLCTEKGLTEAQAEFFLMNYEFYIHGIASYTASGFVHDPESQIIAMANRARDAFLNYERG